MLAEVEDAHNAGVVEGGEGVALAEEATAVDGGFAGQELEGDHVACLQVTSAIDDSIAPFAQDLLDEVVFAGQLAREVVGGQGDLGHPLAVAEVQVDFGGQLSAADRLDEVVARARVEGLAHVVLVLAARENDDRELGFAVVATDLSD